MPSAPGRLLDSVLIDFAYASQTEVGTHNEEDDFAAYVHGVLLDSEVGLRREVFDAVWEPESELLDYGMYPV